VTLTGFTGLLIVILFTGTMVAFYLIKRDSQEQDLRDIEGYRRLTHEVESAVESGNQLHVSLGWGGITSSEAASALAGLSILQQVIKKSSACDFPPLSSTGNAPVAILAQDIIEGSSQALNPAGQKRTAGQLMGLTPFSYAVGTLTTIRDPNVSANVLTGWYGSEVIWLTNSAERQGSPTVAGTAQLPSQAIMYASATQPLIGEELFVGGAYLDGGKIHKASVNTQDVFRWVIIGIILLGVLLNLLGVEQPFQNILGGTL